MHVFGVAHQLPGYGIAHRDPMVDSASTSRCFCNWAESVHRARLSTGDNGNIAGVSAVGPADRVDGPRTLPIFRGAVPFGGER